MVFREVVIGNCRLIQGDCMTIIPAITGFDSIVTDPPYGIKESGKKNASRGKLAKPRDYGDFDWDDVRPDLSAFPDIPRIIWGGNYFDLPKAPRWLIWDKQNSGDFADAEMAWCSDPGAVRIFRWQWNGFIRKGEMDKVRRPSFRQHPTQKPVALMEWCLDFFPSTRTVLDPFMGSGTTGVACVNRGRGFIGIEARADYFDIAVRRIAEAHQQTDMFAPKPAVQPSEQLGLL